MDSVQKWTELPDFVHFLLFLGCFLSTFLICPHLGTPYFIGVFIFVVSFLHRKNTILFILSTFIFIFGLLIVKTLLNGCKRKKKRGNY